MSPRREHEIDNKLLDRFVFILAEELGMEINSGGSTTYRSRRKRRGIEADNSYWIANEAKVRGKRHINLQVDPPPDLAIEVDLTNSSLDRLTRPAILSLPVAEFARIQPAEELNSGEFSYSSLDRLSIYAKLNVPEVWRLVDKSLAFLILGPDGTYAEGASLSFPMVKSADLLQFLARYEQTGEIALARQFRAWVRQRIADNWQ